MNYGRNITPKENSQVRIRLLDPIKKYLSSDKSYLSSYKGYPLINVLYSLPLDTKVLDKIKMDIEEYRQSFSDYSQFKRNNFKSNDPVDIWEGALFELANTLRFNPEYISSSVHTFKDNKKLSHEERFIYIMQNIIKSLPFPESFKVDSLECLDGFDYIDSPDTIAEIIRSISLQIRDYVYGYELLHNFN